MDNFNASYTYLPPKASSTQYGLLLIDWAKDFKLGRTNMHSGQTNRKCSSSAVQQQQLKERLLIIF
ncbi:hypothetical protein T03_17607 [Trichinella britovi]|uniref:Uncharacterized protein n=1 Tax=Trichinella britovi TaxID=45882 RepID=A0A0V1CKB2_TRIBR|nr:hypothetical protein T03_17607 [Trichinella britovi]